MTARTTATAARVETFGTALDPTGLVSQAALRVARSCAEMFTELASGQRSGDAISDERMASYVRSWHRQPDNYDGQCSRDRMHAEAVQLAARGWRESVDSGHFVMRSPDGRFMVRYVRHGRTQCRSYFERAVQ